MASIKLPSPLTRRWVKSRKYAVVRAIKRGDLSVQDAMQTYGLSSEELNLWLRREHEFGPDALRATRVQDYKLEEKAA